MFQTHTQTNQKSILCIKHKTECLHFDGCYEPRGHIELSCLCIILKQPMYVKDKR